MSGEERFDGMFLTVAQQAQGIEPLLECFFGFLHRKTDFFTGVEDAKTPETIVMKYFKKYQAASKAKVEAEKKRNKEIDEERKRKLEAQRLKDKAEFERRQEELRSKPKVEEITEEVVQVTEPASGASGSKSVTMEIESKGGEDTKAPEAAKEISQKKDDSAEEDEEEAGPAPVGNGGTTDKYSWSQTLATLEVLVPVPPGTKARDVVVSFDTQSLKVCLKGQQPVICGKLHQKIKPDDSMWTLIDNKIVQINIEKFNEMQWWSCVLEGDPTIDTKKIVPENSKLSDLDGDTRQTVEKMMFDQRQKSLGLPTSDQLKQHEMLERFKAAHPEMDFSKAKINYGGGGGSNFNW